MTLESTQALDGGVLLLRYLHPERSACREPISMASSMAGAYRRRRRRCRGPDGGARARARGQTQSRSWKRATGAAAASIRLPRTSSATPPSWGPSSSMARRRSRTSCCARRGLSLQAIAGHAVELEGGGTLSRRDAADDRTRPNCRRLGRADARHHRCRIPAAEFCRYEIRADAPFDRAHGRGLRRGRSASAPRCWRCAKNGWVAIAANRRASSAAMAR